MRIYELSPSVSGANTVSIIEGDIVDAVACLVRRIINTPPAVSLVLNKRSIIVSVYDPQAEEEKEEEEEGKKWKEEKDGPALNPLAMLRSDGLSQDQQFFTVFSAELFQLMQETTIPTKGPLIFLRDKLTSAHVRFAIEETIEKLRYADDPHHFYKMVSARISHKVPPSRRTISGTLLRMPSILSPASDKEAITVRTFQATA